MNILLGEKCLELHQQAYDIFCDSRSNNIWSFELFTKSLSNCYSLISIDKSKSVTGFVIANHVLNEIEVENICVAKFHRNQGVACALLNNLILLAQTNKVGKILLEVADTNTPALCLYKSLNFSCDGIRKRYYKINNHEAVDAILMSLTLTRDV